MKPEVQEAVLTVLNKAGATNIKVDGNKVTATIEGRTRTVEIKEDGQMVAIPEIKETFKIEAPRFWPHKIQTAPKKPKPFGPSYLKGKGKRRHR